MAKKTIKKQPETAPNAQIVVDVKADTPSYYVNYVAVSHTPYDFTLSAMRIPSPLMPEQAELARSGQQIPLEPILQLVLPPLLVDGLIKALTIQKEKHQETLAKQVGNNEHQHHSGKPSDSIN